MPIRASVVAGCTWRQVVSNVLSTSYPAITKVPQTVKPDKPTEDCANPLAALMYARSDQSTRSARRMDVCISKLPRRHLSPDARLPKLRTSQPKYFEFADNATSSVI